MKSLLLLISLCMFTTANASDWVVKSTKGSIFDNVDIPQLIIRFDGNELEIENTARPAAIDPIFTTSNAENFSVTPISANVPKSQLFGLLTRLENLLKATDNVVKADAYADLIREQDEALGEVRALRERLLNQGY